MARKTEIEGYQGGGAGDRKISDTKILKHITEPQ